MIAYKVVQAFAVSKRGNPNTIVPLWRSVSLPRTGNSYSFGRTARRKKGWGPLCAFRTLERAREFANNMSSGGCGFDNLLVLRCEVKPVGSGTTIWTAKDSWSKLTPVNGTILCSTIKPLEIC